MVDWWTGYATAYLLTSRSSETPHSVLFEKMKNWIKYLHCRYAREEIHNCRPWVFSYKPNVAIIWTLQSLRSAFHWNLYASHGLSESAELTHPLHIKIVVVMYSCRSDLWIEWKQLEKDRPNHLTFNCGKIFSARRTHKFREFWYKLTKTCTFIHWWSHHIWQSIHQIRFQSINLETRYFVCLCVCVIANISSL